MDEIKAEFERLKKMPLMMKAAAAEAVIEKTIKKIEQMEKRLKNIDRLLAGFEVFDNG